MQSKLSALKHTVKGSFSGWLFSKNLLWKCHGKGSELWEKVSPDSLNFLIGPAWAPHCHLLLAKNAEFFPPKQITVSVLQNHDSEKIEGKQAIMRFSF